MPEDTDDDRDDQTDDQGDDSDLVPRAHIRQLEEKAKKTREYEERITNLEREAAFARALGTAADDPAAKYFVKGYDGELTVEAIREAALEARVLSPPSKEQSSSPDLTAHDRISAASAGAGENAPPDLVAEINAAKSPEEVLDILEEAAAKGMDVPPTTRSLQ